MYCDVASLQSWVRLSSSQVNFRLWCTEKYLKFFCNFLGKHLMCFNVQESHHSQWFGKEQFFCACDKWCGTKITHELFYCFCWLPGLLIVWNIASIFWLVNDTSYHEWAVRVVGDIWKKVGIKGRIVDIWAIDVTKYECYWYISNDKTSFRVCDGCIVRKWNICLLD